VSVIESEEFIEIAAINGSTAWKLDGKIGVVVEVLYND